MKKLSIILISLFLLNSCQPSSLNTGYLILSASFPPSQPGESGESVILTPEMRDRLFEIAFPEDSSTPEPSPSPSIVQEMGILEIVIK